MLLHIILFTIYYSCRLLLFKTWKLPADPQKRFGSADYDTLYCKGEIGCKGVTSQGQEMALRRYFRPDAALL